MKNHEVSESSRKPQETSGTHNMKIIINKQTKYMMYMLGLESEILSEIRFYLSSFLGKLG